MHSFNHLAMPMYTQDQAAYIQQMYEWHMKMVHYHEQKKAYHLERAKHFQKMMGTPVVQMERPNDGVA